MTRGSFCARRAFAALRRRTSEGMVAARARAQATVGGEVRAEHGDADHGGRSARGHLPAALNRPEMRAGVKILRMGTIGLIAWVLGPPFR
jgi:hypothetical protein